MKLSLLTAGVVIFSLSSVMAQERTNNPDHEAGTEGSQMADPQRPAGASNPALEHGTLPRSADATVPPDKNPNVGGATGHTVVPGNNSSISSDKKATIGSRVNR